MERTASRRTAFTITVGVGLVATVVAMIWMAIDHATSNSVLGHVTVLYTPHGAVPDPAVPWLFLYGTFGAGAVGWTIALLGSVRKASWVRWFSTGCFVAGSALLLFLFLVSEHHQTILPTGWRMVCLSLMIYGIIAILVAWLPTTERIRR